MLVRLNHLQSVIYVKYGRIGRLLRTSLIPLHNALPLFYIKRLCFDKQRVWFALFSQTAQPRAGMRVLVKSSSNQSLFKWPLSDTKCKRRCITKIQIKIKN